MACAGEEPECGGGSDDGLGDRAAFTSLLEDSVEDLYDNAPCGYLSTLMDGTIAKVNATLLDWLGYTRQDLVGVRRFSDLLTVGGRLWHETHFAPLLAMQGEIGGVALDLKALDGTRLPVLVTSKVKTGTGGQPLLIRTTLFDARDRRAYETELLRARQQADADREQAEQSSREAEAARAEAEEARAVIERERARLQTLAATLQRSLLPPALPVVPGLEVDAFYHIASLDEVGGDFYDLFELAAGGTWGFFLGDVCGKGAQAATITSIARYTLRAAALADPDPATVLAGLNTALHHEYQGTDPRFATVVFGVLTPHPASGFTAVLASGGHPPAVLLRADGTAAYQETPDGQLIGVLPHPHITTTTVRVGPGDTLLLYTDGLTEAQTARSGRYGDQALLDFAADLAPTTAAHTIRAVTRLLTELGTGVDDDTALLALSVPIGGEPQ